MAKGVYTPFSYTKSEVCWVVSLKITRQYYKQGKYVCCTRGWKFVKSTALSPPQTFRQLTAWTKLSCANNTVDDYDSDCDVQSKIYKLAPNLTSDDPDDSFVYEEFSSSHLTVWVFLSHYSRYMTSLSYDWSCMPTLVVWTDNDQWL